MIKLTPFSENLDKSANKKYKTRVNPAHITAIEYCEKYRGRFGSVNDEKLPYTKVYLTGGTYVTVAETPSEIDRILFDQDAYMGAP